MNSIIRTFLHYCRRLFVFVFKTISLLWPKDINLILFSSWFGRKYADNSMYLYEYMCTNSNYRIIWFTREKSIYNSLIAQGKPVVYSRSIKAILLHLRAKVFISTVQFNDFFSPLMSNCILLDLDHGFPAKYVHFVDPGITKREINYEFLLRKWIRYYMTASSYFTMNVVTQCFALPPKNIVFSNKPRVDVFFDEQLRVGKNDMVEKIKKGNKAIVWMPTHRSCGAVPIDVNTLLDLDNIQKICEEIEAVFIIKKHFYHRYEKTDLTAYSRIFDLTQADLDIQTLLFQADVLISDYSSCYIEYLTMNRPIILYVYDLEDYLKNERGVCVKMEDNHVGYKVRTKKELNDSLRVIGTDWSDSCNQKGRDEAMERYFDKNVEIGGSCKRITELLPSIIDDTYHPIWD